MSAPVIGTTITPIHSERITLIEVPQDRRAENGLVPSPLVNSTTQSVKTEENMLQQYPALPQIVVHAPVPEDPLSFVAREPSNFSGVADELFRTQPSSALIRVPPSSPRPLVIFREPPKPLAKCHSIRSATGLSLTRHKYAIKKTSAYTSWFCYSGICAIDRPPMLQRSLDVEVGDIFLYSYPSRTFNQDVKQIWVLLEDDKGDFFWTEAKVKETVHPIFGDRILAFRQNDLSIPTWVVANTLRRFNKHPVVIKAGEGSRFF
ncbi:hypothetical protein BV25DRAFT_1920509 [Artomyces pyxidatus]|uniref:Uncharacterized protein n=1 Tax=Artomyces pyxidatus TaxID=48021 RepID=A0ACB8SK65_9AGAM|nr:hypothetical protein BV25DRAFT_1920509 [Artomyces pyxidatus]